MQFKKYTCSNHNSLGKKMLQLNNLKNVWKIIIYYNFSSKFIGFFIFKTKQADGKPLGYNQVKTRFLEKAYPHLNKVFMLV